MPTLEGCDIETIVTSAVADFEAIVEEAFSEGVDADAFRQLEGRVHDRAQTMADAIVAGQLRQLLEGTNLDRLAVRAFKQAHDKRYKDEGRRSVKIHFASGSVHSFEASYLRPVRRRRRGRSKKHGNRGKGGKGVFPVLQLLGIRCVHSKMKASPLLEDRVVYAMTASDSHEAARELLARWGVDWRAGKLQNFFERCGEQHRNQHLDWLADPDGEGPVDPEDFQDRRVVVSVDGGRLRLRDDYEGRPQANSYHRFDAPWTEPKLFCIYVVDDEGKRLESVRPLIDGVVVEPEDDETVGADVVFERLEAYLKAISIDDASEVIVVGDGAPWIWKRARPMLEQLGVEADQITEVIDWYHVKSTIWDLYNAAQSWSPLRRIQWRKETIEALGKGDVDGVIEQIEELPGPVREEHGDKTDFFERNQSRLDYEAFDEANVPWGSGAIESAIRRVVNQRMKSNAQYWHAENARTMLLWRSYYKSDRLDDFLRWSHRQRADWWLKLGEEPTPYRASAA